MRIQILGTGCAKCAKLAENAAAAIQSSGLDCQLEKVDDVEQIQAAGVMITPALVLDGSVKIAGRVAESAEILALLQAAAGGSPAPAPVPARPGEACGCGGACTPGREHPQDRRVTAGGCGCGCEGGPAAKYFRLIALALVVVLLVALVGGRFRQGEKPQLSKDFRPVVTSAQGQALPRMLVFGATNCPPCIAMGPTLAELQKRYAAQVAVEYYDVDAAPAVARRFGVRATPTLVLLDAAGKEVERSEGYQPKEEILKAWKAAGFSY